MNRKWMMNTSEPWTKSCSKSRGTQSWICFQALLINRTGIKFTLASFTMSSLFSLHPNLFIFDPVTYSVRQGLFTLSCLTSNSWFSCFCLLSNYDFEPLHPAYHTYLFIMGSQYLLIDDQISLYSLSLRHTAFSSLEPPQIPRPMLMVDLCYHIWLPS